MADDLMKQAIQDSYDSNIKESILQYNTSRTDDICQIRTKASESNRFYNMTDTIALPSGRNAETPNTGGAAAGAASPGGKVWGVDVQTGSYSVKNFFFEDDFWVTDISINSPIVRRQSSAITLRDDLVFMEALEKAYTGYSSTINGQTNQIKIPDVNRFGDKAKAFDWDSFKKMLVNATTIAKSGNLKMKIFMDMDAQNQIIVQKEILSSDYFSKKLLERNTIDKLDWNEITKIEVFPYLKNDLYGKTNPWTKGRIYITIQDCVGKKRVTKSIKGQVVEIPKDDEVMFKSKFMTGAGVVDPEGIFVFEYDPSAVVTAGISEASLSPFSLKNTEVPTAENKDATIPVEEEKAVTEEIETPKSKKK